MSTKEIDRVPVMEKPVRGEMKIFKAAAALGLSIRQVKRIKKRFVREGKSGLIHRSRGQVSNRRLPQAENERILRIVKEKYWDFGPTLALEKLKESHEATLSRESLRQIMITDGIWKPKKKRLLTVHQSRRRREKEGELIQMDGSPHKWFEERGPYCTLLVFIDDATGKLKYLSFVEAETTEAYFKAVGEYLALYGKPVAFYLDRHGIFRVNTAKGGTATTLDSTGLTQFGRAVRELDIALIFANSAQAKGRVEKANETLQDRLVKELRLRGVATLHEGNLYLPEFMAEFNRKFAVPAYNPDDAHRPLLPSEHPEEVLITKEARRLSRNLEFSYQNILYQVKTERPPYALRRAPIVVTKDSRGTVAAYYKGQRLEMTALERFPSLKVVSAKEVYPEVEKLIVRMPCMPAENHSWRHSFSNR